MGAMLHGVVRGQMHGNKRVMAASSAAVAVGNVQGSQPSMAATAWQPSQPTTSTTASMAGMQPVSSQRLAVSCPRSIGHWQPNDGVCPAWQCCGIGSLWSWGGGGVSLVSSLRLASAACSVPHYVSFDGVAVPGG